jgi:hypothetical protein
MQILMYKIIIFDILETTRKQARFETPKLIKKKVGLYWNDKEINNMGWRCRKLQS